ncbi:hypothetical protein GJAV_G00256300, partial [Gymnothorax javanicus]
QRAVYSFKSSPSPNRVYKSEQQTQISTDISIGGSSSAEIHFTQADALRSAVTTHFIQQGVIMKTIFSLLILVLAITCTVTAEDPQYKKFLDQHYKNGMASKMCNSKMSFINKKYYSNRCKEVNSVINAASTNPIKDVCDKAGEPYSMPDGRVLRRSLNQLRVVTCKRKGKTDQPPCDYTGHDSMRNIVIDCNRDKLPVHYEEGHI